jgi:serine/threonine-protein kinase
VLLLDGGGDASAAANALRALGRAHPELRAVVAADGLRAAALTELIEAGAADVARYPLTADRLGPKLARLVRG